MNGNLSHQTGNQCARSREHCLCLLQSQFTIYYSQPQHNATLQLREFKCWNMSLAGDKERRNRVSSRKKMPRDCIYSYYELTWLIYRMMQREWEIAVTPMLALLLTIINELWSRQTWAVPQQTDFHCSLKVRKCFFLVTYQLYPINCQLVLSISPLKSWPVAQESTGWPRSQWLVLVK